MSLWFGLIIFRYLFHGDIFQDICFVKNFEILNKGPLKNDIPGVGVEGLEVPKISDKKWR